jgi:hypothetical protein
MTMTFLVAVISAIVWLVLLMFRAREGGHWLPDWAIDVTRIVFAAATLVTLLSIAGRPVF